MRDEKIDLEMLSRPLLLLGVAAFILNFPFGILRSKTRRFSLAWILCIHVPILPLIFIRIIEGFTYRVITYSLSIAILGQFLGVRVGRWWFSS